MAPPPADLLTAALAAYRRHHPQPDPAQLASIERLITAEGAAFDLARWTRISARIAAKQLRGRVDLVIADYRRLSSTIVERVVRPFSTGSRRTLARPSGPRASEPRRSGGSGLVSQLLVGEAPAG